MKQNQSLIIPNVSGIAKGRRMDSVVPEPPQRVQEERFGANFQPLPVDTLVTFQRFPGFTLLAKHTAAIHKVTTQWRQRGIGRPVPWPNIPVTSSLNRRDTIDVIACLNKSMFT